MPGNPLFLITFSLAILLTYIAIRRRWLATLPTAIIGGVVATASFVLFSLSSGNVLVHALVVGILLGLVFSGLTVSMAVFFRANPPGPKLPLQTTSPANIPELPTDEGEEQPPDE